MKTGRGGSTAISVCTHIPVAGTPKMRDFVFQKWEEITHFSGSFLMGRSYASIKQILNLKYFLTAQNLSQMQVILNDLQIPKCAVCGQDSLVSTPACHAELTCG